MYGEGESDSEQIPRWLRRLIIVAVIATVGFGLPGMWVYERHVSPEGGLGSVAADAIYHTLQLLVMESPHLEGSIPWTLHAGRFSGAAFFLALTILAFARLFPDEWKFIKLRLWTKNHVVICGLGEVGTRLALEGRKHKRFVVAIEKSCPTSKRESMREKGVLVLDGDATEEAQLKQARVQNAGFVVASCPEDGTNVAIAARVGKLLESAPSRREQLVCRTLIADAEVRQLLYGNPLFQASSRYRVNFSDLDRHALAARQALRLSPLDFKPIRENDDTLVRLVVVGFGGIGQGLAVQAARIGHFANEVGKQGRRLRLTIVDAPGICFDDSIANYSHLGKACDLERVNVRAEFGLLLDDLHAIGEQPDSLTTFAFCCDNDEKNFRLSLELAPLIKTSVAQILCYQKSRRGFAALLSMNDAPGEMNRLHPFGMVEDIVNWENFLHEEEDTLARALHEDYLRHHPKKHSGWDELPEDFRDSNRQAADHIEIKLRALGYHSSDTQNGKHPVTEFEESEIDLLARMEHARWCASSLLDGWQHGDPTDGGKKLHRCLVDWPTLITLGEHQKDRQQIAAIPKALKDIGKNIYR